MAARIDDPATIAEDLVALHSSDPATVHLAVVARQAHAAATERIARAERKRTLDAFSSGNHIDDAPRRLDRAIAEIVDLLAADGPLATRAIGDALPHLVVPVVFGAGTRNPATLKAHTRVLLLAVFEGVVLRGRPTGSWTSSEYRWHTAETGLDEPLGGLDETTGVSAWSTADCAGSARRPRPMSAGGSGGPWP